MLGFQTASTNNGIPDISKIRPVVFALAAAYFAFAFTGLSLGFEGHSEFLFGIGGLPNDVVTSLPWVRVKTTKTTNNIENQHVFIV